MKRIAEGAALVILVAVGIFAGSQLMKGQEVLPVALGKPAPPKLAADVAASKRDYETATFGMG